MANDSDELRTVPYIGDEEGGPVKCLLEQLEDLRWLMIRCLSALVVAMVICMIGAPLIIEVLTYPLSNSGANIRLEWLNPLGGMVSMMKMALWGGITIALPFLLYFIADFVLPAL